MKQDYEPLFLSYRPRTECSSSQFCNTNCTHLYSGRSKQAWAFSETVKKNSKITYTASRFSLFTSAKLQWELSVWMKINRVTLLHSKEFFISILYLMVLERCVIFKSVWYARHFEYSCKRCSLNDWKQSAQRLKLQERLLTINKRNIIRWNIYRDNNFHSRRQVLKCL